VEPDFVVDPTFGEQIGGSPGLPYHIDPILSPNRALAVEKPLILPISERAQRVKPSATLSVTARAAELRAAGKNVIGLGAGEPDFDTPAHIKQAAIDAIGRGFTKYTAVDGIPELKAAIQAKFERDNQLRYEANQILVSVGAKQTIFNLCQAILDQGDEVVIPAPYWVSYPDIALLSDATPVPVFAGVGQGFKISPEQLDAAISPKTRLFMLNSPSNPTGAAYTRAELQALGEVLARHEQVVIATDDMYEHIYWAEEPFCSLATACPDLYERTVTINGVSKCYAMTGWRIGYCGGPAPVIAAMKKIQGQSTSNPVSISQVAAVAALDGDQACVTEMNNAFKQRHDFVVDALNRISGFSCRAGEGTFYAFPDVSGAIAATDGVNDDIELAEYLINEVGVALVPGSAFGAAGYLRLSFAYSLDTLRDAIGRLAAAFDGG
jgi:aspartate aminotransferase